ncbi:hypothetical protein LGV61_03450 [Desulfurispirillum indicum]|uniref:hypothetical protein n=1 Tax=Desulfurispirillum indicum TaxID=936456 RepID=UPI001CFA6CB0|nr:hypothetical protein [Desulfurispirillum indicum]UCZ57349.1 hypothetical protein LGV61_03450 [Desulfurispirillum indicum]
MILFDFAEVSIAKVSLLGTELLVGRPEILMYTAWLLWLYFLLRYYQYFREIKDMKIKALVKNHLHGLAGNYARKKLKGRDGEDFYSHNMSRISSFSYMCKIEYSNKSMAPSKLSIRISWWRWLPWHLKSWWHIGFNTRRITDYIIPFFVAFATTVKPGISLLTKFLPC